MAVSALGCATWWRLKLAMLLVLVVVMFFILRSLSRGPEVIRLPAVHSRAGEYIQVRPEFIPRKKSFKGCENNPGALFDYGKDDVLSYCNSPFRQEERGDTGEGINNRGYQLLAAYVVIRHGDRSPMGHNNSVLSLYKQLSLSCKFDDGLLQQASEMSSYVRTMSSHSYLQTQFNGFELHPESHHCGSAMLTPLGATQHVKLGLHLQGAYVNKHKLLAENFTQSDMLLMSTNRGRTVQSALAFLYGFLPGFSFSKFRLDIGSYQYDNYCDELILGQPCKCGALLRLKAQMREDITQKIKTDPILISVADRFSGAKRAPWPAEIMDVLMGYACHNVDLPKLNGKCVDIDDLEAVVKAAYTLIGYQQQSDSHRKASVLIAYPLVLRLSKLMAAHMYKYKAKRQPVKFALFSGHDTTISPLLTALGLHDGIWPPFASRLTFELYRSVANERLYMRVVYLGKDVTRKLRFCGGSLIDGMCPLKNFLKFAKVGLLREFQTTSYEVACSG
ncbi:2-phosphoxylose phosphatase 1 [Lingula anatina]|uniref:2-phosphoxylose phosphatase 1 n=1 Tax=Lingula anatina TaxID=7574 RepID=A0A1S3J9P8_LINAN|nr:2-phosphoxylose phosphatase 1 [Lingula anatina]|eukprot:XP_013407127.2 2-phosphoxylose phosphatase 1 [Lingula anatina]